MCRRVFALILAGLCLSVRAEAAFVCANAGEEALAATATSVAASVSGVSAGNLIAAYVKHEGAADTITVAGNGTSTFSAGTKVTDSASSDTHGQWHYLLSAPSGVTTVTATFGATKPFRSILVFACSYTGTASFDTEPTGGGASGLGTAVSSGAMTTTGTDEAVLCGYSEYSAAAVTAESFSAVAADAVFDVTGGQNFTVAWRRVLTGTTTGACTATLGSSENWVSVGIAFKAEGGGAPAATPRLMLLGVGDTQ